MKTRTRARALAAATVTAVVCMAPLSATSAAAASDHYVARAFATNVCKEKYGGGTFGASIWKWGPDGIYCYGIGFPAAISYIGGVNGGDFQHYCRVHYGADAVFRGGVPTIGWWCDKRY